MNVEWTITGIILLGAMAAGGISLYLKRRKESKNAGAFSDTPDSDKYLQDKK
jgi:LPXTG-motif cell wall-anchored protein